ncbi:unnamed protein product, partial [Pylaiella littoralis]
LLKQFHRKSFLDCMPRRRHFSTHSRAHGAGLLWAGFLEEKGTGPEWVHPPDESIFRCAWIEVKRGETFVPTPRWLAGFLVETECCWCCERSLGSFAYTGTTSSSKSGYVINGND